MPSWFFVVIGFVLAALAIVALMGLQYYLSTRNNRIVGLILPSIFVLYSMLMMLEVTIFSFDSVFNVFLQMMVVFLLCNIPSLVLVVVYASCRSKLENNILE